jgi:hypothetical protein
MGMGMPSECRLSFWKTWNGPQLGVINVRVLGASSKKRSRRSSCLVDKSSCLVDEHPRAMFLDNFYWFFVPSPQWPLLSSLP